MFYCKNYKTGFSLAELLVALSLLGVISAISLPKLLQNTQSAQVEAKVKDAVSIVEQAYYGKQLGGTLTYNQPLYQNIADGLNASNQNAGSVTAAGAPFANITSHPCTTYSPNGWVQFAHGVVVTGLAGGGSSSGANLDSLPWNDPSHTYTNNYVLCIDVDGAAGANTFGTDVFIGNFNQYGGFTGPPAAANAKAFNWGAPGVNVVNNANAIVGGTGGPGDVTITPLSVAASKLMSFSIVTPLPLGCTYNGTFYSGASYQTLRKSDGTCKTCFDFYIDPGMTIPGPSRIGNPGPTGQCPFTALPVF